MRQAPAIQSNTEAFDGWIRSGFVELNTALEELYFRQENRATVSGIGDEIKARLVEEGQRYIHALLEEGNTDEGFDAGFDLLGNVGLFMGACRRHELAELSDAVRQALKETSALALQLGASLGVAPRFATSHLTTHNRAVRGSYRMFTSLEAEAVFLEYNTRAILAYKRAADAIVRVLPMGVSHPVACDLLETATQALGDVIRNNAALFEALDIDRFFYCVRPYYKPYRVGLHEYRGANAGDFAGINEIDVLLGLCQPENLSYSQLLVEKFLFMMPEDQQRLRDCMRRRSLMDQLLDELERSKSEPWFQRAVAAFLTLCEAHGEAARQHHDQLVERFITHPSDSLPEENLTNITASGPPLHVMLSSLEKLRDLRSAADRDDIPSRYRDLLRLRAAVA